MTEPTVSAGIVRGLAAFAAMRGPDTAALYRAAGLAPADLEDNDARIPLARYQALTRAAEAACDEPALALLHGEAVEMPEVSSSA